MCIRDRASGGRSQSAYARGSPASPSAARGPPALRAGPCACLLYTSDAADERSSVDLGGRRIIKKKDRCDPTLTQRKQYNLVCMMQAHLFYLINNHTENA